MIGVFIQTGGGTAERKEKNGNWEMAPHVKLGQYLLYSNMPGVVNHHHSVVADRRKNSNGRVIPNAFEISRYGRDLEVEINGQRIFSGENEAITRLQDGVYVIKQTPHRIVILQNKASEVEIQIFDKIDGREREVARAKLAQVSEEQEKEILIKEDRVSPVIHYHNHEGLDR